MKKPARSPRSSRLASRRDLFTGAATVAGGLTAAGCAVSATVGSAARPAAATSAPAPGAVSSGRPPGIPGPFPGRVIEIHDPRSVSDGRVVQATAGAMLSRAMTELCGTPDAATAWRRFFQPGDRVGLKVNCVGHPVDDAKKHAVYTSHEMLREVVTALRAIGVRDLLLFDRYRAEFTIAKYPELAAELGIPWAVSAISWDQTQIDMDGFSGGDPFAEKRNGKARTDGSARPLGYDPEVFLSQDFVHPLHNPVDPRTRRSHVARIVTQKVDKIINLCLIKDHAAAGITGALKNLSHGLVDNVCRSHSSPSLNQTATFIPAVLSLPIIREKVVLNVMEGFRGLFNGGPWASPDVFEPCSLLVSTDPVAIDRISMDIIDARRKQEDLPTLLRSGGITDKGQTELHLFRGGTHVELAGALGLGVYAKNAGEFELWHGRKPAATGRKLEVIEHRRIVAG